MHYKDGKVRKTKKIREREAFLQKCYDWRNSLSGDSKKYFEALVEEEFIQGYDEGYDARKCDEEAHFFRD